jgi:hypothetical protein
MPKQQYALDEGGPKDLEIEWRGVGFKQFTIRFQGQDVTTLSSLKDHPAGVDTQLPNGRHLFAQWKTAAMSKELVLLVDGKPLPGSAADPESRVKAAAGVTWFIAAMNGVLGVVGLATQSQTLEELGIGLPSIFFGAVFATLGFFIWKRHSAAALYVAIGLFALDTLVTVGTAVTMPGGSPPMGGLILRAFLFIALFKAVPAVKELQLKKAKLAAGAMGGSSGAPASVSVVPPRDPPA